MSHRTMQFRRKRSGQTNYKKRLELLKSGKTRLVIRVSNNTVNAQLIDYSNDGDIVRFGVNSSDLNKYGWTHGLKSISAAYLTGFLLGKKSKGSVKEAVLDLGLHAHVKGGRVYAALKGVIDSGVAVPASEGIFPIEERISGAHIKDYASKSKQQFTKDKNVLSVSDDFKKVKDEIQKAK